MNGIDSVVHETLSGALEYYGEMIGYVEDFKDCHTGEESGLGDSYVKVNVGENKKQMLVSEAVLGGYVPVPCLINNGEYVKM